MTQVEQLQKEIDGLSDEEFMQLRRWFAEKDGEHWDRQIEAEAAKEQKTGQEL